MARLLSGQLVAEEVLEQCRQRVDTIKSQNKIIPALHIIDFAETNHNKAYINGLKKVAEKVRVPVTITKWTKDVTNDEAESSILEIGSNNNIGGILLMQPFPKDYKLDVNYIKNLIPSNKDVDAISDSVSAAAYLNNNNYVPCTAEACIKILELYNYEIEGKNIVVVGRSKVVGKPVSQLLLNLNATVTICHSKTKHLEQITKRADIVILATGTPNKFGKEYFSEQQTILDAGINWDVKNKKLCGDVNFTEVEPIVKAITPVPGGVGPVTSSILIQHVLN